MKPTTKPHLFQPGSPRLARAHEPRPIHPLDGRLMGTAAHQVIAALVSEGERNPDLDTIRAAVLAHPSNRAAITYRQSARQRLMTAAAAYFDHFPPLDDWVLVGSEVPAGACRFDLVWADSKERIWVDELKTGRSAGRVGLTQVASQVKRQVTAGSNLYGAAFAGVRVCLLAAPGKAFWELAESGSEAAAA